MSEVESLLLEAILFVLIRDFEIDFVGEFDENHLTCLIVEEYDTVWKCISTKNDFDISKQQLTTELVKKWLKHRKFRLSLEKEKRKSKENV